MSRDTFKMIYHDVDFCVVGGGLAGLCAAVEAARHGVSTALAQEMESFIRNKKQLPTSEYHSLNW